MRQNLSKEEKELLLETPEKAIRRILFWKDFKPEFKPPEEAIQRIVFWKDFKPEFKPPEEAIQEILFWKDFKPVFRPVDQIKSKSLPNQPDDSGAKSSGG